MSLEFFQELNLPLLKLENSPYKLSDIKMTQK